MFYCHLWIWRCSTAFQTEPLYYETISTFTYILIEHFFTAVPNDFDAENLGKRTLKLYTHETCMSYQRKMVK